MNTRQLCMKIPKKILKSKDVTLLVDTSDISIDQYVCIN